MMEPLLSVIVPVYNVRPYIDECINSILTQSYRNVELLLINDGSTDGSGEVCDSWADKDSRVRVMHQENKGQAAARNCGLSQAKGKYLWFIDSDDYITPSSLFESLVPLMIENYSFIQIPFIKSGIRYNRHNNICISSKFEMYSHWINGKQITNYLCDKIWRRDVFHNLWFKEGMIFEDRFIFVDLLNRCNKVLLSNVGEYFYRTWQGQTTVRKRDKFFLESMLRADLHILEEMPKQYPEVRRIIQNRMFSTFIELSQLEVNFALSQKVYKTIKIDHTSSFRMILLKTTGPHVYIFLSRFI